MSVQQSKAAAITSGQLLQWAPSSVPELSQVLATAVSHGVWARAGMRSTGFSGVTTRHHEDLDVDILRRDQHQIQGLLANVGWDLHAAADDCPQAMARTRQLASTVCGANRLWGL